MGIWGWWKKKFNIWTWDEVETNDQSCTYNGHLRWRTAHEWSLKCSRQAGSKGNALLFSVSKQNMNLSIGVSSALKIIKNILKLRKLWPPKVEGVKEFLKKPLNITKPKPNHSKKFFVCCSIAIRVPRWFVKLKVALLSTLNHLKWMRKEKVRVFQSRRGTKRRKKREKNAFCELESFFFPCYFFIAPFHLHFKDYF